jgi:hypothetical protein
MKKRLVLMFTLFFILVMAFPALAEVQLNVNGKDYNPGVSLPIEDGRTLVPANIAARTIGAEYTVQDKQIEFNKNGNILQMTEGSLVALYNGEKCNMPVAPQSKEGEILVPLRFVCESFSAQVVWQAEPRTVAIQYQEKRNGMTPDEMLGKSSQVLSDANSYRMNMDTKMAIEVKTPGEENETANMDTSSSANCAYQAKPLVMYIKQQVSGSDSGSGEKIENIETEMLMDETGVYMTMPETGWVKMDLPGLDLKTLIEQSGSQDIMSSINKMKESGVLLNYGNDAEKDGQKYWVLNITMSPDSFQNYLQAMMKDLPAMFNAESTTEQQSVLNDLFNNMKMDMFYRMWIDQNTYLPRFMDVNTKIDLTMKINDGEKTSEAFMKCNQDATCEMYDFGISFTVPDVSSAISMTEYMEKQIQATQPEE